MVVATKFLPRTNEDIEAGITGQQHIEKMVKSLQNLGMEYIDLYIYHMWDYRTPIGDILEGMSQAVKAGKVRFVGATKLHHIEAAAKTIDLVLADEELDYLEEMYVPHRLVGVMAQNTAKNAQSAHVWSTGNQTL